MLHDIIDAYFIVKKNLLYYISAKIALVRSKERNGDAWWAEEQIEGSRQRDSKNVRSHSQSEEWSVRG